MAGRGWAGAFTEAAHADRTDGYDSNPIDRATAGGRLGFGTDVWSFDALVSWQWRDFGCTGSYGASEKYPAWEEDRTGLVYAVWKYDADDDQASELSVLWTRGRDAYWLDENQKVALSYREGMRQPSFTELTYDSPDSKGTLDLPLQRTRTLNLDWTWARTGVREGPRTARLGSFLARSEDLVDWLKTDRNSGWKATALDAVMSFGISGDAEWAVTKDLALIPRGGHWSSSGRRRITGPRGMRWTSRSSRSR